MKRVRMLKNHEGAKAGDVVGFEDNAEADALIAAGAAEPEAPPETKDAGAAPENK